MYKICLLALSLAWVIPAHAIKIAAIFKLNDSYSRFPQDIIKGMRFAIKKTGSQDIIFQTYSHDGDNLSIEKAILAARNFNPDIVVTGETSQFAMTIARAFKDKIFVTPTASSFMLEEVHDFPIRMIHKDDQYVNIIKHLRSRQDLGRIGIFHNVSYPNTNRISLKVKEYLNLNKLEFSSIDYLNGEHLDATKLSPLIRNKIQTLIIFSYDTDLRKVYAILKDQNIHPLYVGGDGWGRDSYLKENLLTKGSKFTGYRTLYWNENSKNPIFTKTKKDFENELGTRIDAFHAIGFDTMKVILETIKSCNYCKDQKQFVSKLKEKKFEGLLTTTSMSYNKILEPEKDMYLFKLDSHGIQFESKVIANE